MITKEALANNINSVRNKINNASQKAGRNPDEITLIAVTKTVPVERIMDAYKLGLTNFGENYPQEALPKIAAFHPQDVIWHMIGHLQSNKVNKIVPLVGSIHTVDTLALAQRIDRIAEEQRITAKILLQVNISGEISKRGMTPAETASIANEIEKLNHISLIGLMTIPPFAEDPEASRPIFRSLRLLQDKLKIEVPHYTGEHLSMGMSNDFSIAIEEGATMIRVGQAIFGSRVKTEKE